MAGEGWDVVFCSDMLDLAQFRGLAPSAVHRLPAVAYFHENQLTYPVRFEKERDLHFGLTNLTTALAASAVWWSSAFHRDASVNVISDRETGRSRGFAFVEMEDASAADDAQRALDGTDLAGRSLRVDEAQERRPRPVGRSRR